MIRLAGALLVEQCDEWLVGRRYLSAESLALVLVDEDEGKEIREEVRALQTGLRSQRLTDECRLHPYALLVSGLGKRLGGGT